MQLDHCARFRFPAQSEVARLVQMQFAFDREMMEARIARAVSYDSSNDFVFRRQTDSMLTGICVDLWNETSRKLNLTYSLEMADQWTDMFTSFNENRSDIIVQRIDENQLEFFNATK